MRQQQTKDILSSCALPVPELWGRAAGDAACGSGPWPCLGTGGSQGRIASRHPGSAPGDTAAPRAAAGPEGVTGGSSGPARPAACPGGSRLLPAVAGCLPGSAGRRPC